MRNTEAANLKVGDLVIVDSRNKHYGGLVLEIESISPEHDWCGYLVTLKQPGFDCGFRIKDYESRHLQRFEP